MPDSPTRVFLCYRHEDTPWFAQLLTDRLRAHFDHVFVDLGIRPGDDFTQEIKNALNQCKVLLALIGTKWASAVDEQGQRRLDNASDWVVQEISEALKLGVRVIPVLVDGAVMPKESALPPALANLANRHAVTIGHQSFDVVAETLIKAIENELGKDRPAPAGPDQIYHRALEAMRTGDWSFAATLLGPLLETGYPGAAMLHAEAVRQVDLTKMYDRAVAAIRGDHLSEAMDLLGPLVDAGYRDARSLAAEVTKRVAQEVHYHQARRALQAGDWSTATALLGPLRDAGFSRCG